MGEYILESKSSCKYLGVLLDEHLRYQDQTNKILASMAIGIKTILQIRHLVPLKTKLELVKSLVLSHIQYPIHLLNGLSKANVNRLNRQINWALRCCYQCGMWSRMLPYRVKSGILPAEYQIQHAVTAKTWSIVQQHACAFKSLQFPNLDYVTNHRTGNLALVCPGKTTHLQKSFLTIGMKNLNKYPKNIKQAKTLKIFKKQSFQHLLQLYSRSPQNRDLTGWNNFIIQ